VVNTSDFEAVACANVLKALLAPLLCENAAMIPRVVEVGQELPDSAERVVVVFTSGCFDECDFVLRLLSVRESTLQVLPVIAEEDFHVPSRAALEAAIGGLRCEGLRRERSLQEMASVVLDLFKEIAVNVNTKRANASVLNAAVAALGQRLRSSSKRRGSLRSGKSYSPASTRPGSTTSRSPVLRCVAEAEVTPLHVAGLAIAVDDASEPEDPSRPTISSNWRGSHAPDGIVDFTTV